MQMPRAILFDLDDTIISAYGQPLVAWGKVAREFAAAIAPNDPHDVAVAITAAAKVFWGDASRHRVPHPVAEAPVGAGVEPTAGPMDLDVLAGVRHEVTAVADHDCIAIEPLAQLAVDPSRLDRIAVRGQQRCLVRDGRVFGDAQLGQPA